MKRTASLFFTHSVLQLFSKQLRTVTVAHLYRHEIPLTDADCAISRCK